MKLGVRSRFFSSKAQMNVLIDKIWEIILESHFKICPLREGGGLQTIPSSAKE